MEKIAIEVNNLTKTYKLYEDNKKRIIEGLFPFAKVQHKDFNALEDVSFQIRKGEIVGIIGKNGSGKSTLLKIITGVLTPSQGEVKVNGRISALLELGSGFNPEYTGIENIYLNGTLCGIARSEMKKKVDDIADFADIGDFIYQPVKNYSSGMFVRLAFAVAINVEPDILIVDEALAVGDAAFQAKCMARMNQIMKSGATVLFVTHDMNTVKQLCQRCIYLENGIKIMEGPAEELADIYLKKTRLSMNEEHMKILADEDNEAENPESDHLQEKARDDLVENEAEQEEEQKFAEKVERFREGTGDARYVKFEITDEFDRKTEYFEFNQIMKLKTYLKFYTDKTIGVGYHIRDDKNVELLGGALYLEGKVCQCENAELEDYKWLRGKAGETYLIEYTTRLPLIEGNYNISLVASKEIIPNRTALFIDYIENAAVFEVGENVKGKLWNKVYIKNDMVIKKLEN